MKQKRKRKHNFIEVENEITYAESIVSKLIAENLILFCHFVIFVSRKTIISFCANEVLKIIKISCTLTLQLR